MHEVEVTLSVIILVTGLIIVLFLFKNWVGKLYVKRELVCVFLEMSK